MKTILISTALVVLFGGCAKAQDSHPMIGTWIDTSNDKHKLVILEPNSDGVIVIENHMLTKIKDRFSTRPTQTNETCTTEGQCFELNSDTGVLTMKSVFSGRTEFSKGK